MKTPYLYLLILFSVLFSFRGNASPKPDSITVYVFMLDACVICKYYSLTLGELHKEFANEQVSFQGIFPNFSSKPAAIQAFKEKYRIPFELKTDYYRKLTKRFNASVTPEVVVYNHDKDKVLYQGRIDNTYAALGKRRRHTTSSELKDVLEAIRDNKPILVSKTESIGCLINQNDKLSKQ